MINFILDKIIGKAPLFTARSGKWPKVRKDFLAIHTECAACGSKNKLEVHHIVPFHLDHALELDPTNFIALCESKDHNVNCHLHVGHNDNFRNENANVVQDAEIMRKSIK